MGIRTNGKTGLISALIAGAALALSGLTVGVGLTGCDVSSTDPIEKVNRALAAAPERQVEDSDQDSLGKLQAVALWRLCGEPVAIQYLMEEGMQVVIDDGESFTIELLRIAAAAAAGMDLFQVELRPGCSKV